MTVGELLTRISSHELSEWMAYEQVQPFGDARADVHAGIVAATIANVNRDPKRQKKPFRPQDFMPRWEPEKRKEQTWEEQLEVVRMLHVAFGGEVGSMK